MALQDIQFVYFKHYQQGIFLLGNSWLVRKFRFITVNLFFFQLLLSFTPLEFLTSVLADDFSLEFEWQQLSSSLQESS